MIAARLQEALQIMEDARVIPSFALGRITGEDVVPVLRNKPFGIRQKGALRIIREVGGKIRGQAG